MRDKRTPKDVCGEANILRTKFSEFYLCFHNCCPCLVFGVIADNLFYLQSLKNVKKKALLFEGFWPIPS